MRAEYMIDAGIDISGILADLKKVDSLFDEKTLRFHVDYDKGDIKDIQSAIDKLSGKDYILSIQMQYDLNKSILDAQTRKLENMTDFTISGKMDSQLAEQLDYVRDRFELDVDAKNFKEVSSELENIQRIVKTIDDLGGNIGDNLRKSINELVNEVEAVYGKKLSDVGEALFSKNDIADQQKVVETFQGLAERSAQALNNALKIYKDYNFVFDNFTIDADALQSELSEASKGLKLNIDKANFDFKNLDDETKDKLNDYFATRTEAANAYQARLDENEVNEKRISELIEENKKLSAELAEAREALARSTSDSESGGGNGVGSASDDDVAKLEEQLKKRKERLERAIQIAREINDEKNEIKKELESTQNDLNDEYYNKELAWDRVDEQDIEIQELEEKLKKTEEDLKSLRETKERIQKESDELSKVSTDGTAGIGEGIGTAGTGTGDGIGKTSDDDVAKLEEKLKKRKERLDRAIEIAKEAKEKQTEIRKELSDTQKALENANFWGQSARDYSSTLVEENFDLSEQIEKYKSDLEEAERQIRELESIREKLDEEIKYLDESNSELLSENRSLETSWNEEFTENKELSDQLSKLKEDYLEASKTIEELEEIRKECDSRIKELTSDAVPMDKYMKSLDDYNDLWSQYSWISDSLEHARLELEKSQQEIKELKKIQTDLQDELDNTKSNQSGQKHDNTANRTVEQYQQRIEALTKASEELETSRNKILELEKTKKELDQAIEELTKSDTVKQPKFGENDDIINSLRAKSADLEDQIQKAKSDYEEALAQIKELSEFKEKYLQQLEEISHTTGTGGGSSVGGINFGDINLPTESIQKFMASIEELVGVLGELKTALSSIGDIKFDLNINNAVPADAYRNIYEENRINALAELRSLYKSLYLELRDVAYSTKIQDVVSGEVYPIDDIDTLLKKLAVKRYGGMAVSSEPFKSTLGSIDFDASPQRQIASYKTAFDALKEVAENTLQYFDANQTFDKVEKVFSEIKSVGDITKEAGGGLENLFKGADLSIVNAAISNIEESLKNLKLTIGQIEFPEDISGLTAEQAALAQLKSSIDSVMSAIDAKTEAFRVEGQVVDGVVNEESSNLTALVGWIDMIAEQVERLQNAFKELGDIKFDQDLFQSFSGGFNIDKINSDLTELLESFIAFTELTNGLKIDGISFIGDINNLISKSSDLRDLISLFRYVENEGIGLKEASKRLGAETGNIKPQKSIKSQMSSLSKYVDGLDLGDERFTNDYLDRLRNFKVEAEKILKSGVDLGKQSDVNQLRQLMDQMKILKQDAKKAENKVLTDSAKSGFDNRLASFQKNLRSTSEYINQIEDLRTRLQSATTMGEKNAIQDEFNRIKTAAQSAGDVGVDTLDKLKKKFSDSSALLKSIDTVDVTDSFKRRIEFAKNELSYLSGVDYSDQADVDRLSRIADVISKIADEASKNKIANVDEIIKMSDEMENYKETLRSTSPFIKEISDLEERLFMAESEGDRMNVAERFNQLKEAAKSAGDVGVDTLKDLEDRFSGLVKEVNATDASGFTESLRKEFENFKTTINTLASSGGLDFTKSFDVRRLENLVSILGEIRSKSEQSEFKIADQDSVLSMTANINKLYDSLSPSSSFRGELNALREQIKGIVSEADRLAAQDLFNDIKLRATAAGDTRKSAERSNLESQAKSEIQSLYKLESQTRSLKNEISSLQAEVKANGGLDMIPDIDDSGLISVIEKIRALKKEISDDTAVRTGKGGIDSRIEALQKGISRFDLEGIPEHLNTTFNSIVSDVERLNNMKFTMNVGDINTQLSDLENRLESVTKAAQTFGKVDTTLDFLKELDKSTFSTGAIDELKELENKLKTFKSNAESGKINIAVDVGDVEKAIERVKELTRSQKEANYKAANEQKISNLDAVMASFSSRLKSNSSYIGAIEELREKLKSVASSGDFDEIVNGFNRIRAAAFDAGDVGKTAMQHLGSRIKQMSVNAIAMYFSFYDIIRYTRQAFQVIKEYDTALTEMRKVSDYSVDTLKEYQKTTYGTADAIGTTALQLQNSTADYMRLGESIEEAKKSAEAATILMNVSEFENISEATDSLIAMSAAFDGVEKMDIVDKMNEIGNNYAISTDGVATALQASAASLVTAGNDIDEAVALVTAGNVVTQDPNKVGTGMRTIALRLTGTKEAKKQLEELGEDTDNVITTQSKLRDTIMSATKVASNEFKGFDILDSNGNYKSTLKIMLGLSEIYDEIAETDKKMGNNNLNLLLETIAGKNRSNIAASILQNGDILRDAYASSVNASGSAMKENEKYLDSLEGKIKQFKNAAHEAITSAVDAEWLKDLIDLGTDLLHVLNAIIQAVDFLPGGIFSVLGGAGLFGAKLFSQARGIKFGGIVDVFKGLFNIEDAEEAAAEAGSAVGDAVSEAVSSAVGDAVGEMAGDVAVHSAADAAGEAIGAAAGDAAGEAMSEAISGSLGEMASTAVGDSVGEAIGTAAGDTAGEIISTYIGDSLGEVTSTAMGDSVGEFIGTLVGDSSGEIVGDVIGETVGGSIVNSISSFISAHSGIIAGGIFTAVIAAAGIAASAMEAKRIKMVKETNANAEKFATSTGNIESQIARVQELRDSLASGTLSEQESYTVKSELLAIQESLVGSYGDMADAIDLVNGGLESQKSIMEDLADQEASNFLNENSEGIENAKNILERNATREFGTKSSESGRLLSGIETDDESYEQLKTIVDNYASLHFKDVGKIGGKTVQSIVFEADDYYEAQDELSKILQEFTSVDLESDGNLSKSFQDVWAGLRDYSKNVVNYAIDTEGQTYEEAQNAEMRFLKLGELGNDSIETASDLKSAYQEAANEYNDAINGMSDKTIAETETAFNDLDEMVSGFLNKYPQYAHSFDSIKDLINLDNLPTAKFKEQIMDANTEFGRMAATIKKDGLSSENVFDILTGKAQEYLDMQNDVKEAAENGFDVSRRKYGNIDLDNRQELYWDKKTIEDNYKAIASYYPDQWSLKAGIDDMEGTLSTVLGSSKEYDGVEIAFSPILQTDDGPKLLGKETVDKYISSIMSGLGDNWYTEDLLALDAEGMMVDGIKISNLVADAGQSAIKTGEEMHYSEEAAMLASESFSNLGNVTEEDIDILNKFAEALGYTSDGVVDSAEMGDLVDILKAEKLIQDALDSSNISDYLADTRSSYYKAMKGIDDVNAALANQFSGKGLTATIDKETGKLTGNIADITDAYKDLEGFDAEKLFIKTANGIKINEEELRRLQAQQEKEVKSDYADKIKEINEELVKEELVDENSSKVKQLKEQRAELEALQSAYEGSTSAYNDWLVAQSAGSSGKIYDTVQSTMVPRGDNLLRNGLTGNNEFRAIAEFVSGKDLSSAGLDEVTDAYKILDNQIGDTCYTARDFVEEGKEGLTNFVNAVDALGKGYVELGEDGKVAFNIPSTEALARDLGVGVELVDANMGKLEERGYSLADTFDDFALRTTKSFNHIDTVNSALAKSFSSGGLSASFDSETGEITGDVGNIIASFKKLEKQGLKGFDPDKLFIRTANGIRLNTEELRALQAQQEELVNADFETKRAELEENLANATKENNEAQIKQYTDELKYLKLAQSAYAGMTSGYQGWINAQSAGERGSIYDNIQSTAIPRGDELLNNKLTGTNEFRSIAELVSGQDLSTASVEEVIDAYGRLDQEIGNTGYTVRDTLKEGTRGSANFVRAIDALDKGYVTLGKNGKVALNNIDPEQLSKDLNMSLELVMYNLDKLADRNYDISLNLDDVTNFAELQSKVQTALQESSTATGLSEDSVRSLMKAYKDIESFRPDRLFERTENGIRLNREELDRLNAEVRENTLADLYDVLASKREELYSAKARGADTSAIDEEIAATQSLISQYEALTSAYNQWQQSKAAPNERDPYAAVGQGYKETKETIDAGWYNDQDVKDYIDLVMAADRQTGDVIEDFNRLTDTSMNGTGHSLMDYFQYDENNNIVSDGVITFLEDVNALLGDQYALETENGWAFDFTGDKIKDVEEATGLATGSIELLARAAGEVGAVTFEENGLVEDIKNVQSDLKKMQASGQLSAEVDLEFDAKTDSLESLRSTIDSLEQSKVNIDPEVDPDAAAALDILIDKCQQEYYIRLNASTGDSLDTAIADANQIYNIINGMPLNTNVSIKAAISGNAKVQELAQEIASLPPEVQVAVGIKAENVGDVEGILSQFADQTINVGINYSPSNSVNLDTQHADGTIDYSVGTVEKPTDVTVDGTANYDLGDSPEEVPDADGTANFALGDSPSEVPDAHGVANYTLGNYPKTAPTISGTANYSFGNIPTRLPMATQYVLRIPIGGKAEGTMTSISHAHADGTMSNVVNLRSALANGKISLDRDEIALVNELGQESIIRDGKWMLLPPGMHQEALKKGDIVLSAAQTESLLRTGRAMGLGKAHADGTLGNSYASGSGIRRRTSTGTVKNAAGTAVGSSSSTAQAVSNAAASTANSAAQTAKSTGEAEEKADEFKETLDEIEILLDRVDRQIEHIDKTAQGAYNTFITRNNAISSEIDLITKQIDNQQKAYDRYLAEANKVGLDEEWASKVRDGRINIEEVTDEDLWDKIEQYREWYEKAIDCKDAIDELKDTQADLDKQRFDNLKQEYEDIIDGYEHLSNVVQAFIDTTEESDHVVATDYYSELIRYENQQIAQMVKEREQLSVELESALAKGRIKVNSEEFDDMKASIDAVTESILEAKKNVIEFNNAIRQLKWDQFDRGQEWISDLSEELQFYNDLLDTGNAYDKKGKVTNEGIARFGVMAMDYDVNMQQAQYYASEIKKINKDLAKDPYNLALIDRKRELVKAQQESILAAKQEKEAMRDLVKEGIEKQIESLGKLIDDYTGMLDNDQSAIEYARQISEKQEEIDKYRKQMFSWEGDNSEEGAARRQKTADELRNAEDDLAQAEEDRRISEIKESLADLQDHFSEVINMRLDDINRLFAELINGVNLNAGTIESTITKSASDVGATLSTKLDSALTAATTNLNKALSSSGTSLTNAINAFKAGNASSITKAINKFAPLVSNFSGGAFKVGDATILTQVKAIVADVAVMSYNAKQEAAKRAAEEQKRKAEAEAAARAKAAAEAEARRKADAEAARKAEEAKRAAQQKAQQAAANNSNSSSGRSEQEYYGVALAIWNGTKGWGAGQERINKLRQKGFDPNKVQNIVNQISGNVLSGNWEGRYYGIRYSDLDKYAYNRFAKGAKKIDRDQIAITQEEGREFIMHNGQMLTPLTEGDSVFNKLASDNLWNFATNPEDFLKSKLETLPTTSAINNFGGNNVSMTFNLSGMKDPETFMTELQHNKQFAELVQELTLGRVNGHGILAKNSIRF